MTATGYTVPSGIREDIDAYEKEVTAFLAGTLPAGVLKAKRVPRGVYEQRRDGTYMVRVRVAGGCLSAAQACALASIALDYGDGRPHVTTRQDVQFHEVKIQDTPAVMRRLLDAGLTSKGGGGNTVRNVTACPYAGYCPAERFDVRPAVRAVTEYLIPLVGSYNLPRKYKIAFSGCRADCALAQVADLGFTAVVRDGKPGFRLHAGGGLGAHSKAAVLVADWIPVTRILHYAEGVRRLFDKHGDRQNRNKARLRFVADRMGAEVFRREVGAAADAAAASGVPAWAEGEALAVTPAPAAEDPPQPVRLHGLRVIGQRQRGLVAVPLPLPLGFLPASDLEAIGRIADAFSGEGALRATRRQGLLIPDVREERLPELARELARLETDVVTPAPLERFVACAGASTCRLGICLARSAARACAEALAAGNLKPETLDALDIHINGCANACGQQPVGAVGLFGVAQRAGDRLVPSYGVTVGGRCGRGGAILGTSAGRVPAFALPGFLAELAAAFERDRLPGEAFPAYADRVGTGVFSEIAGRHAAIPSYGEKPEAYRDLGAETDFSLAGRGAGECGAGVFEVIRQDLDAARQGDGRLGTLVPAARALLITRGVDAREPADVLREFEKHFIDTGLVAPVFRSLLDRARGQLQGWAAALEGQEAEVARLRERVELLYGTLDSNLVFHPPEAAAPALPPAPASAAAATAELNLRGVACPMNFVKAKLRLETLAVGEILAVVLDEGDPIRNVPESFRNEGQEVVETADLKDGHWRVTIRKKQ